MPMVSKDKALKLLTNQVQKKLGTDELLEVYNEVFPKNPCTEVKARVNSRPLIADLVKHFHGGLEIDEVIDLWRLIFPGHRNVWYDEEEERIHYNEEVETVPSE